MAVFKLFHWPDFDLRGAVFFSILFVCRDETFFFFLSAKIDSHPGHGYPWDLVVDTGRRFTSRPRGVFSFD